MSSVNKVILVGRLGANPETRDVNGTTVANFSIATSESWKDKTSGEKQERTEWHRVVAWGRQGEIAGEYLNKGSMVYVEGQLQTRKWQDKEGVDRYTTEIRVGLLRMLSGRNEQNGSGDESERPVATSAASAAPAAAASGDDIPF